MKPSCPRCCEPATTAEDRRFRGKPSPNEMGKRSINTDHGDDLRGAHAYDTDLDGNLWWICVECGCLFEPKAGRQARDIGAYEDDVRGGWRNRKAGAQ